VDTLNRDIFRVLFDERCIEKRVRELGAILSKDYYQKNPILVCILRGAVVFLSDLMKSMTLPLEIDFLSLSSYGRSTKTTGMIKVRKDIDLIMKDRHVIIVEDIVDSGLTLQFVYDYLTNLTPKSVSTCVLLNKPSQYKVDLKVDYIGFEIGDEFVVGYGLDYAEKYRNLPYIGVLKEDVYK